jgi:hypothetical protein
MLGCFENGGYAQFFCVSQYCALANIAVGFSRRDGMALSILWALAQCIISILGLKPGGETGFFNPSVKTDGNIG